MALQIRRGTNAERLGITLVEGEVVYVTDFELVTIEVTSVNASTNTLTTTLNHGLAVNDQIRYMGTTSNGLTEGTVYFVKAIPSQTDFTLSTSQGGLILDITGSAASLVFAVGPKDAVGVPYGYSISPLYVGDGITAGGNPAGASVLDDLYDVTIGVYGNVGQYGQALANNNVIQYNDVTNQWENRANLTLNGSLSQTGQTLTIDSDSLGGNSRIYFKGTTAEIRYDDAVGQDRFELNKDLLATGLQGGNIQIGTGDDNQIYNGSSDLRIDTQLGSGYKILSNADISTSAENIYINSNGDNLPSTLFMKGTSNFIRLNTATGFFEFTDNLAKGSLLLSSDGTQGTVATTAGPINLNTPSGSSVNVQRNLVVGGDLTVNGTTTTVNSTTLTVDDKNIELAATTSPNNTTADGGGITLKGSTDKKIIWNNSNSRWSIDNGDNNQYVIPINIDDLNDVVITGTPASGEFLFHNGTNWINDNKVTSLTAASRAVFEYKPTSPSGIFSSAFFRRDFATNTYANGDGVGIGFQFDSNSQNSGLPLTVAFIGAIYDTVPEISLRTSTDSFSTNSVEVANFNNDIASIKGLELILNAGNDGAASDVQITVDRGTTGANAYIKWDEDATTPQWFIGQQTQIDGRLAVNGSIFTEAGGDVFIDGNQLVLNNGNAGATSSIVVARTGGGQSNVAIRWNESSDRWETTINGSTYIELPNQDLDTDASPTFAGLTGGNIRVGVTGDNEIDTSTGGLTLDSASGTVTVDDNLTVSGDITHNGSTATFNNAVVIGSSSGDALTVNATATFQPNVTFNNDIDVKGGQIQNSTGALEIISTGANNIIINPGSGTTVNDGHMVLGQLNTTAILTTNGTGSLDIRTGSWPTSANITLADGANGNITVETDGTGQVVINAPLDVNDTLSCVQITLDGRATFDSTTATRTSTAEFTLDSTNRNAIKAMVYMERGTDSHIVEILMMRTTTDAMITTYGEMYTTSPLATFTADLDVGTGLARIRATPTSATSTTFSVVRTSLT